MYRDGQGVVQDYAEAAKWYRKAAEQGYASAQSSLGVMYGAVAQDYVRAHMWFSIAASGGHKNAAGNRQFVAKRMTPPQIAEAQRMARDWLGGV
jgi:TPR repeat protein